MNAAERLTMLRYLWMGTAAMFAFATPYVLFPDANLPIHQLANLKTRSLLRHLIRKQSLLLLLPAALSAALILVDPKTLRAPSVITLQQENMAGLPWIYLIQAALFIVSIALYSTFRYLRTGERSQYWKESDRGQAVQAALTNLLKTPMDAGSLPSLLQTVLITTLGMITVVAGAYLSSVYDPVYEMIPTVVLTLLTIREGWRARLHIHASYYQTNAFFREYFRTGLSGDEEPATIEENELWWVPRAWRADMIPVMTQLVRRYPASRWICAGHGLLWLLAWQQPGHQTVTAVWGLFLIMHHVTIFQAAAEHLVPAWFARWLAPSTYWMKLRFWMQLRWLLVIGLSLSLQSVIFAVPTFQGVFGLMFFFVVSAAVSSWISEWLVHRRSGIGGGILRKRSAINP